LTNTRAEVISDLKFILKVALKTKNMLITLHKHLNLLFKMNILVGRGGGRGSRQGSNAPPHLSKILLTPG